MPCFRGIDLSVVSTADCRAFPEFPHPDGSSARFGGLNADRKHKSSVFLSPRPQAEVCEGTKDDVQKVTPRISVYIPSAPDTCFYIQYRINQLPIGHKYLFFKVHINGRQIVAWGINLHKTTSGATNQALFQPSEHYQYNDDGVVIAEPGIESRCFLFVPNASGTAASVAEDGGLIEIQVFRAKTRRRRAPRLDKCLVSNGLLENPHLADYYDYHLADARDLPYSSFLFHYRSWDNLRQLQLAPPERPEFHWPDSPYNVEFREDFKKPDRSGSQKA
ncbi:hypothetical protein CMQ_6150 [Grosmannia clavigera kw1407]|uniref:Uncharacterized protein n=1 Tax=Grosmannia clavigera (strain kw1407 / UAMH 11150) TaxID=655863 RepID=F0XM81_GROCL|nr:uncharacterized protein CMQ_6150 [Grosmannia clavigera kw1407]EFX01208.1 hypothetical protein CMQ_6150 [Grosmannia clavigera kw1407]